MANHAPVGRRSGRRAAARSFSSGRFRLQFERLEPRLAMAGVVINEFLALNTNGLSDEDGDESDWIELRNTDAAPVNVGGWYLADSEEQWQLPSVEIPAGAYLLVFASGKDRAVAGEELHTNFQLSGDGERLALLMPDGTTVVDEFDPFPPQVANVSYGRGSSAVATETLVDTTETVQVHVPTSSDLGTSWTAASFVPDGTWQSGDSPIGYERGGGGIDYSSYFEFDVNSLMPATPIPRDTIYMRIPFSVADVGEFQSLTISMLYDDGYVAYLNGHKIAERNATASPQWDSSATTSHSDSVAIIYEPIPINQHLDKLIEGNNVLAIHGLNQINNRTDFLIGPMLLADRALPGAEGFMATPTPGAANAAGTLGVVADTTFSVDRGFYDAPFSVEISTATPEAVIRYTLDGSQPTATHGLVYNPASPPSISTTTTLRAAAFRTGWTPTNVDTQTYIFLDDVLEQDGSGLQPYAPWSHFVQQGIANADWAMDPEIVSQYSSTIKDDLQAVPTLSVVMNWNELFGAGGIYISGKNIERAGSVEMFDAQGSTEFQIDGAVEIMGQTSTNRWNNDKLSFRVTFKQPFGPTDLNAALFTDPIFDQGATTEIDTFILDAVYNHSWTYGGGSSPTVQRATAKLIQDQFTADLQNLTGGYSVHGRFVHLYLNGLYWGMYYLHERPDDAFAASYMGGDNDDYDVIKHVATDVVAGPATATANYNAMLNVVRQNLSIPANYAAAQELIDIDHFIDYMLVNYYVGNHDWALNTGGKNWYATYNRVDANGKWRFHSWDAEHVLESLTEDRTFLNPAGQPTEIHNHLMTSPEYRLRFADRVQNHFFNGGVMTPEVARSLYAARMAHIDRAIVGESARWGDNRREPPYRREEWLATQNDLLNNYFPFRTQIVLDQFIARGWRVQYEAPLMSQYGGTVEPGYQLTLSLPPSRRGVPIYYTLDGSDPRDPATNLPRAGALLYSAPITIDAQVQVKARIFIDDAGSSSVNEWSPIVDKEFFLPTPYPLRFTELHYNPVAAPGGIQGEDLEFIEFMNVGSQTINLAGVQITQFGETPYTFASRFLAPGERIVVARNPSVFQSVYGTGINLASTGYGAANLSNGGERIALLGPLGETLQDFVFDDEAPWPTSPDGGGYSLQIIDPLGDASDPANWRASNFLGGSPGGTDDSIPGDYDGNGLVEQADAAAWRASFGMTAEPGTGADGNRNGIVDAADFVVWRARMSAAQAAGAANSSLAVAAASGSADSEAAGAASVSARDTTDGIPFPESNRSRSNPSRRILFGGRTLGGSTPAADSLDLILVSQFGEDAP
ncbi:MAG TPA: lamin tail domain-containing protein, partial [Lacipirellulaceae bacterium]